jgi:DNA-binding beta-propeller fold protein YncE
MGDEFRPSHSRRAVRPSRRHEKLARRRNREHLNREVYFRRLQVEALEDRLVLSTFTLGTSTLLETRASGSDTDLLAVSPSNASWTATSQSSWLHLSGSNTGATGSATVLFTFDANSNATARTGTLTIAGNTLTVTQAGTSYAAAGAVTRLVTGLYFPTGVAVDVSGNVYIADAEDDAIKEWVKATGNVTTLISTGLSIPSGVAVDGSGNLYIADKYNNAVEEWVQATNTLNTLVSTGLYHPQGVALDASGNVYVTDSNNTVQEWISATNTVTILISSGLSSPAGVAVDRSGNVYVGDYGHNAVKEWLNATGTVTTLVSLSSSPAGVAVDASGNVYIADYFGPTIKEWVKATGNVNTLVSTGLLDPFGVALDVSGNVYIADEDTNNITEWLKATSHVTTLVSTPLISPYSVAVDSGGNVYIAGYQSHSVQEWLAASNTVTTLFSSPFTHAYDVAVDGSGNVYTTGADSIQEWVKATSTLTTLVSGLLQPQSVAVDNSGNVYITETDANVVQEWVRATGMVTTLVSSGLYVSLGGVAVDAAGNVYIADAGHNALKEWVAATGNVATLVSTGLSLDTNLAVDGSGNVYCLDWGHSALKEFVAASGTFTTLMSTGFNNPFGAAVDASGNLYFALANQLMELPRAYVGPTTVSEGGASGNDALLQVLPSTENLSAPFLPTSDQSWLTIGGITGGVVNYSFTANPSASPRTANISILGQTIPVTQAGYSFSLGTSALVEPATSDSDTDTLAATYSGAAWTASPVDSWLHLSTPNQSGTGNATVLFTFDANPNTTPRTGSLTIAGQTLSVTQAGTSYVAAGAVTTLVSSGLYYPSSVAVDGSGNVYIPDAGNNAIKEWLQATGTVTTLVSSGLNNPRGVAVDGSGNVYIADTDDNAIKEWVKATSSVTMLVSTGLSSPAPVAVDGAGNVFIADYRDSEIKEWVAATSSLTTLVSSGLIYPDGVAVDGSGNVYIADEGNYAIKEWLKATNTVTTLVTGLSLPIGVAVDGSGNVYFSDADNSAVKEWLKATGTVTTLVSSGLFRPAGVALDGAGNVYIPDTGNNAVKELPRAYVGPLAITEPFSSGSDTDQLTITASAVPWTATANDAWLHVSSGYASGTGSAFVQFTFDANPNRAARTGTLTIAGNTLTVTQAGNSVQLNILPIVVGAYASGTNWGAGFFSTLDGSGLGDSNVAGEGFLMFDGANQLTSDLPWTSIDTISIAFNKNVTVSQASLTLYDSSNNPTSPTSFSYDSTNFIAHWTFPSSLAANIWWVGLTASTVTDSTGAQLDGDWTTGTSTFAQGSGDGTAGGDFNFLFNILPGDVSNNGIVSTGDVLQVKTQLNATLSNTNYRQDINANGVVTTGDVLQAKTHLNTSLSQFPTPVIPPAAAPSAASPTVEASTSTTTSLITPDSIQADTPRVSSTIVVIQTGPIMGPAPLTSESNEPAFTVVGLVASDPSSTAAGIADAISVAFAGLQSTTATTTNLTTKDELAVTLVGLTNSGDSLVDSSAPKASAASLGNVEYLLVTRNTSTNLASANLQSPATPVGVEWDAALIQWLATASDTAGTFDLDDLITSLAGDLGVG